jgi:hypothetical protein
MANRERAKKAGRDAGKKRRRMREAVRSRKERSQGERQSRDEVDSVKYKRGSAGDRTRRGAP